MITTQLSIVEHFYTSIDIAIQSRSTQSQSFHLVYMHSSSPTVVAILVHLQCIPEPNSYVVDAYLKSRDRRISIEIFI